MAALEERGLFWWADELLHENQLAPAAHIGGLLIISDDGQTRLELDGCFPSTHGPMSPVMRRGQRIEKNIQGILTKSNKRALLIGLTGDGGQFSSNGISYEHYIAEQCLLSDEFGKWPTARASDEISVPLGGFEGWLRLTGIKVTASKRTVSIKYTRPKDAVYRTENGKLSIHFGRAALSSGTPFGGAFSLEETASANLIFNEPMEIKGLITQYRLLEDLLLVLTGSDRALDWPWIVVGDQAQFRLYFAKPVGNVAAAPPHAHECVTNFAQLREHFGEIWSNWKKKREAFGPGFYLYLGTRRGVRFYVENRFTNLVFGLEAFHRRKYPPLGPTKLDEKIERIVAQVSREKDKVWLMDVLERVKDQPPLGQRLYITLQEAPLGLDNARLKDFCEACAKLRNDISHFGGQRHEGMPYDDFILDLERKSEALSSLYQALILHEIGIDPEIIKGWAFDSFGSFRIKHYFVAAGLLDKSVLDPKR